MAYETFAKRGKRSRMGSKPDKYSDGDYTPANMYAAVDFGGKHPDPSRRRITTARPLVSEPTMNQK
jgi:hypothetical protein